MTQERVCNSCGDKLSEDASFCATCGTRTGIPAGVKCSDCGRDNRVGAKVCRKCGRFLISKPDEEADILLCQYCGKSNSSSSRYCERCGRDLSLSITLPPESQEADILICTDCGKSNSSDLRYCERCGLELIFPTISSSGESHDEVKEDEEDEEDSFWTAPESYDTAERIGHYIGICITVVVPAVIIIAVIWGLISLFSIIDFGKSKGFIVEDLLPAAVEALNPIKTVKPSEATCERVADRIVSNDMGVVYRTAMEEGVVYEVKRFMKIQKLYGIKEISRTSTELVCEGEAKYSEPFYSGPRKTIRLIYYADEDGDTFLRTEPVDPLE